MHVLVTGASGFIASRTIEQLLAKGHRVRGTVRSLGKEKDLAPLRALPGAKERLELVQADLLTAGSFDAPAQGCDAVLHMASPYVLDAKDPQKDLVDPAVMGTESVLSASEKAGTCAAATVMVAVAVASVRPVALARTVTG